MGTLGKCPKCGVDIVGGQFGPYCTGKCGMYVSKAFGKELTDVQVSDLLGGKKVLLKGLVSRKSGKSYDMYVKADGIEDYSYTKKDGTEASGSRWKFETSFPEKKKDGSGSSSKDDDGAGGGGGFNFDELPPADEDVMAVSGDEELPWG